VRLGVLKLEKVQSMLALLCSLSVACSLNLACTLNLGVALASPPAGVPMAIGTVEAKGSFRVDNATVAGNATLFEGATVETHQSTSMLALTSGVRVWLAADSKGRVFRDHLLLERGLGQMEKADRFRVLARGLTVQTESTAGSARVELAGTADVQVAALAGSVQVRNSQGLLVASIHSGSALHFAFQASGASSQLSGCLRAESGHYLVTDEVSYVTMEAVGPGLAKESGNRVQVTGAIDPSASPVLSAMAYLRVSGIKRLSRGCAPSNKPAAAGAAGVGGRGGSGGSGSGAATAGGIGALSATTIAVIGGVAVAAAIGGLAASGSLSGSAAATLSR